VRFLPWQVPGRSLKRSRCGVHIEPIGSPAVSRGPAGGGTESGRLVGRREERAFM